MERGVLVFAIRSNPVSPRALGAASVFHGAGLRLLECCRPRVQDVDFASNQIVVHTGKGDKDRVTMLPAVVRAGRTGKHASGADILSRDRLRHASALARYTVPHSSRPNYS